MPSMKEFCKNVQHYMDIRDYCLEFKLVPGGVRPGVRSARMCGLQPLSGLGRGMES